MPATQAHAAEVSAIVVVRADRSAAKLKKPFNAADVVVWLTPLQPGAPKPAIVRQTPYRLVQQHKMFIPHLLVIPTGTSVEFPNKDPFFHNVFSLYNGKRFDLGPYESGTTHSVRFDREGVSYIFCNIHPEMGAVVLALSTPFYAVSGPDGAVVIHNVPPGSYRLGIWSENSEPASQTVSEKIVQVSAEPLQLGEITLLRTPDPLVNHKNKFGADYVPSQTSQY